MPRVRTQVDAAERVVAHVARDVRAIDDGLDERTYLRLGHRIRAGSGLLVLRSPIGGPVAVEVETFEWRRDGDGHAVPVVDRPLREHTVEVAFEVVGLPGDEQPRIIGVRLPGPVRVAKPHHEDTPVAVDVLAVEAVLQLLAWVRPNARPPEPAVGEPGLCAVRVDPRNDVKRACVEGVRDARILAVVVEQPVEQIQCGRRPRELHRVDLRVDEDGRLLVRRASLEVRDRGQRNLPSFVGRTDRLHAE